VLAIRANIHRACSEIINYTKHQHERSLGSESLEKENGGRKAWVLYSLLGGLWMMPVSMQDCES